MSRSYWSIAAAQCLDAWRLGDLVTVQRGIERVLRKIGVDLDRQCVGIDREMTRIEQAVDVGSQQETLINVVRFVRRIGEYVRRLLGFSGTRPCHCTLSLARVMGPPFCQEHGTGSFRSLAVW